MADGQEANATKPARRKTARPRTAIRAGQQLDRYEIVREIGAGGMGTVYEAVHVHLRTPVALKVLELGSEVRADSFERFRREAQALAKLDHPNIVKVSDFGVSEGRPFFAMDLLRGRSLQSYLDERGRVPIDRAIALMLPVLDALEAAHRAGIVHRDIKPSNIVIEGIDTPSPSAKLVDFGISRWADRTTLTVSGAVLGTPHYIAPEQFDLGARVDARADVYGIAMVLFRMVAGRLPHGASPTATTKPEGSAMEISVPPEISAVIRDALAVDPGSRPGSAREFSEQLQGRGSSALPSVQASSAGPLAATTSGRWWVAGLVGGALLTAVAMVGGGLLIHSLISEGPETSSSPATPQLTAPPVGTPVAAEPAREPAVVPAIGHLPWFLDVSGRRAHTSAGGLAPQAAPVFGTLSLSPGFAPDPRVASGQAGGPISGHDVDPTCEGYYSANPSHVLLAPSGFQQIRFIVNGGPLDTWLFVMLPNGRSLCSGNGAGGFNPLVVTSSSPGPIRIWVGSDRVGRTGPYNIGFSERAQHVSSDEVPRPGGGGQANRPRGGPASPSPRAGTGRASPESSGPTRLEREQVCRRESQTCRSACMRSSSPSCRGDCDRGWSDCMRRSLR